MTGPALILLSLGLSVDSLAVSVSVGLCQGRVMLRHALKVAVYFAFFQTMMPFLGYRAGLSMEQLIAPFDHWIAFILLSLIGVKMIYENVYEKKMPDDQLEQQTCPANPLSGSRLALLGLATSVDALAAGVSLSISGVPILPALLLIGLTTFIVAGSGMLLGRRLGVLFQRKACIIGGVVLILIGSRILLDHFSSV